MAQSELTVTPPSPTPPTNMGFIGSTPPNPGNFEDEVYADPENGMHWGDETPGSAPPPYFDDGTAGGLTEFVSAHPSVPENGTSVEHEGRGTEVEEIAPGSIEHDYEGGVTLETTVSFSCLGDYTTSPNGDHASAQAPAVAPTISGLLPATPTSGAGQVTLTVNGTGFRQDSFVTIAGIAQPTVYVSATQLKVLNATKKATAGNLAVAVNTGGTAITPTNWVFS